MGGSKGSQGRKDRKKAKRAVTLQQRQQQQSAMPALVRRLPGVASSPGRPSVVRLPPVARSPFGLGGRLLPGVGAGPVARLAAGRLRPLSPEPHFEAQRGSSPPGPVPQVIIDLTPSSPVFAFGSLPSNDPPGLAAFFDALAQEQSPPSPVLRTASSRRGFEPLHLPPGFEPLDLPRALLDQPLMGLDEFFAWQQARGDQIDQRTGLMAISTRSPATTGSADLGVVPTPSGQADTRGLGIPRPIGHAGSGRPFRGDMALAEVNDTLLHNGFDTFDRMSNERVLRKMGCSPEGHALSILLDFRQDLQQKYNRGLAHSSQRTHRYEDCRLSKSKPNKEVLCERCGKFTRFDVHMHRLSAILAEPVANTWMAVLFMANSKSKRLFQASHNCHHPTADRCITAGHVFLETQEQNSNRMKHHNNNALCDHIEVPCRGPDVVLSRQ